jgi:ATP-dependent exoDNAse (exonuclease V) alpha subunit
MHQVHRAYTTRQSRESSIAVGYLFVFNENNAKRGHLNGLKGVVLSTHNGLLQVQTDAGKFDLDLKRPLPLRHGYVTTVHSAQGATCDRALILCRSRVEKNSLYTAVSRAKSGAEIYAPTEGLQLSIQTKRVAIKVSP